MGKKQGVWNEELTKKKKVEQVGRTEGKENLLVLRMRVPQQWFVVKLHALIVFSNGKTACYFLCHSISKCL